METKTVLAQGAVDQTIQNVFGPFVDVLEKSCSSQYQSVKPSSPSW